MSQNYRLSAEQVVALMRARHWLYGQGNFEIYLIFEVTLYMEYALGANDAGKTSYGKILPRIEFLLSERKDINEDDIPTIRSVSRMWMETKEDYDDIMVNTLLKLANLLEMRLKLAV